MAPAEAGPNDDVQGLVAETISLIEDMLSTARQRVLVRVADPSGGFDSERLGREQRAMHALAWADALAAALYQLGRHTAWLEQQGRAGAVDRLIRDVAFADVLAQMLGGIPMSQSETARPADADLSEHDLAGLRQAAENWNRRGGSAARHALADAMLQVDPARALGDWGDDDALAALRAEIRRSAQSMPIVHAPSSRPGGRDAAAGLVETMAEAGIFRLALPEDYGGRGLDKMGMCIALEELSRGSLTVASLAMDSRHTAELILEAGTEDQKRRFLPGIASGAIIPASVATECGTGSDFTELRLGAAREGDIYRITGNTRWIRGAARGDLVPILVRTDPTETGRRGLSIFLAEKPHGTDDDPFPVEAVTGGATEVLFRGGTKVSELSFDGFPAPAANLLGVAEGEGAGQLMRASETSRIGTAALAVGVSRSAFDLALSHARERRRFGPQSSAIPRLGDKLALMAVGICLARVLMAHAARESDAGRRSELEAGMAALLSARALWAAADDAGRILGDDGLAPECPVSRAFRDARELAMMEGSTEREAQVIARRLLEA